MPLPENMGRPEAVAGGTTVAEDSQKSLWIGLAALLIVVGLVIYFASGDEDTRGSAPTADSEFEAAETEVANTGAAPVATQDTGEVGMSLDEAPPSEREVRDAAIATFKQTLTTQRLWSTISVAGGGTTLILVSGSCSDDGMKPAISQNAAALSAVGIVSVRCQEKHGAQVFEQRL